MSTSKDFYSRKIINSNWKIMSRTKNKKKIKALLQLKLTQLIKLDKIHHIRNNNNNNKEIYTFLSQW